VSPNNPSTYFVHTLLRARDWQHRPQLDEVYDWWRGTGILPLNRAGYQGLEASAASGRGVCALVGMGGAGKTAIAERFLHNLPASISRSRKSVDNPSKERNSGESDYQNLRPPHSFFVYSFYNDEKRKTSFATCKSGWKATHRRKSKSRPRN
jgi:hypothetical protein